MMTEQNQILCPKCGSNQLTANQKGFSGGKALAGAVLTGGIGLLAGTIGSKDVIITCLSCGKQFKPGEGKTTTDSFVHAQGDLGEGHKKEILRIYSEKGWPSAASYAKQFKKMSPLEARRYVEQLGRDNNVTAGKAKGCAGIFTLMLIMPVILFLTFHLHHIK